MLVFLSSSSSSLSSLFVVVVSFWEDGCRVSKTKVRGRERRIGCKSTIAGAALLFVQLVRLPPRGDLLPGRCFPFRSSPHGGFNHSCSGREAHSMCQVTRRVWEGRNVALLRRGRGKVLAIRGGDVSPDPRFPQRQPAWIQPSPAFQGQGLDRCATEWQCCGIVAGWDRTGLSLR